MPIPGAGTLSGLSLVWTDFVDQPAAQIAFDARVTLSQGDIDLVQIPEDWNNPHNNGLPLVANAVTAGRIPIVSWPRGGKPATWVADTLAGTNDAKFTEFATLLAAIPGTVIWRFGWEMNQLSGTHFAGNSTTYVSLWKYVHDLVLATAPNVQMFWCPGRFSINPTPYYPGSSYVTYTGFDVYSQHKPGFLTELITARNGDYYSIISALGKPMLIGELGCREQDDASFTNDGSESPQSFTKTAWFDDVSRSLFDFPEIVGWCLYDQYEPVSGGNFGQDWRFDTLAGAYLSPSDSDSNSTLQAWWRLIGGKTSVTVKEIFLALALGNVDGKLAGGFDMHKFRLALALGQRDGFVPMGNKKISIKQIRLALKLGRINQKIYST